MTPLRTLALALPLLLPALLTAQNDEPQVLRYRFEPGASGHYVLAQRADMNMKMGEREMATSMDMEMFMQLRIADVTEGKARLEQRIDRIKLKTDSPMTGAVQLDTDDEASVPAMFDRFVDMVGQSVVVVLDTRGKALEVKLPAALEQMAGGAAIDFEQAFSHLMPLLPEEPVAVGHTWTTSSSLALGPRGKAPMTVENKLLNVQGDDVTIAMKMKMDLGDLATEVPAEIKLDEASGRATIDLAKGLPKGSETTMKASMSGDQGGMAVAMKMAVAMSIKPAPAPAEKKADAKSGDGEGGKKK